MTLRRRKGGLLPFFLVLTVVVMVVTACFLILRLRLLSPLNHTVERRVTGDGRLFDMRDSGDTLWLREIAADGRLLGVMPLPQHKGDAFLSEETGTIQAAASYHLLETENGTAYLFGFRQPSGSERWIDTALYACHPATGARRLIYKLDESRDVIFGDTAAGGDLHIGYLQDGFIEILPIDRDSGAAGPSMLLALPFPISWFTVARDGVVYGISTDSTVYRYRENAWEPLWEGGALSAIAEADMGADGCLYLLRTEAPDKSDLHRFDPVTDLWEETETQTDDILNMRIYDADTFFGLTKEGHYRLSIEDEINEFTALRVPFLLLWSPETLRSIAVVSVLAAGLMLAVIWLRRGGRIPLMAKITAAAVPVFAIGAFLLITEASGEVNKTLNDEIRSGLLASAADLAESIDVRRFESIRWDDPLRDEYYLTLQEMLAEKSRSREVVWFDPSSETQYSQHLYQDDWLYRVEGDRVYFAACGTYVINLNAEYYYTYDLWDDSFATVIGRKEPVCVTMYSRGDEGDWLMVLYPLLHGGEVAGILEISSPAWDIERYASGITRRMLVFCIATLAAILLTLVAVLAVSLGTLRSLGRNAAAISRGDYSVRTAAGNRDETGDIARAFNLMASSVESAVARITATGEGYSRFVPTEMLSILHKDSICEVKAADYIATKSVFMLLTTKSFEGFRGQRYVEAMNRFYAYILPVLEGGGGVVERFGGYELRALFASEPHQALDTVLAMFSEQNRLNAALKAENETTVHCGVLLSFTNTFLGVVGSEQRLNMTLSSHYTHASDEVQAVCLQNNCRLLLDESMCAALGERGGSYRRRLLGYLHDGGEKCALYDFYDSEPICQMRDRDKTRQSFERGVGLYYDGRFKEALGLFLDIVKETPEDMAAREYLKKSHRGLQAGATPEPLLEIS